MRHEETKTEKKDPALDMSSSRDPCGSGSCVATPELRDTDKFAFQNRAFMFAVTQFRA
jgi:hypothetical protein